jgi:hypothetical protein
LVDRVATSVAGIPVGAAVNHAAFRTT